jgi:hypothetical protein
VSITSSKHGQQRKRARLGPESHSSSDKPYRGNKVISGGKPRKVAPSRVQKTYRNRQKVERSSPKRCAKRDVDYDEIPLLKATLNSHTAKERMLPPTKFGNVVSASKATRIKGTNGRTNLSDSPTVGSEPAVEIPDDKKQEKRDRSRLAGVRPVQGPPAEIACDDDDDPIQSFSSSPSELISSAVEKVGSLMLYPSDKDLIRLVQAELQVLAPHETSVHSDCLPMADSLAKSLDIPSSVGATHVREATILRVFPIFIINPRLVTQRELSQTRSTISPPSPLRVILYRTTQLWKMLTSVLRARLPSWLPRNTRLREARKSPRISTTSMDLLSWPMYVTPFALHSRISRFCRSIPSYVRQGLPAQSPR